MLTLFSRGVGVHTNNWRIGAKQQLKLVFYTLRSHAICPHVMAPTVWAFAGRIGVRVLRPLPTATVTNQRMRALMVRERRRAMRTLGHTTTLATHQKVCKSAAIKE